MAVKLLIDKAPSGGSSGSGGALVAPSPVLAAMEEEASGGRCWAVGGYSVLGLAS